MVIFSNRKLKISNSCNKKWYMLLIYTAVITARPMVNDIHKNNLVLDRSPVICIVYLRSTRWWVRISAGAQVFETVPQKNWNGFFVNGCNPLIHFTIPTSQNVKISVYDLSGRQVRLLVNKLYPTGSHQIIWNGKDERNNEIASGIYLYRFESDYFHATRKMMLMR